MCGMLTHLAKVKSDKPTQIRIGVFGENNNICRFLSFLWRFWVLVNDCNWRFSFTLDFRLLLIILQQRCRYILSWDIEIWVVWLLPYEHGSSGVCNETTI